MSDEIPENTFEEMANDKKIILTNLANESDDDLKKKIIEYLQPE